jgi:gamma-glutamyltranspeptidase/glutathione hydrolase
MVAWCAFFAAVGPTAGITQQATSHRNMVATVHPLATEAGLRAFDAGGNAVDAAIAAALTLGVVDGFNSGIGGGCFILVRDPAGNFTALDGREIAPAAAHRDMFLADGQPQPDWSRHGPLAVAVPGALAAYAEIQARFGRRPLAELLTDAAQVADTGFVIDKVYADQIASQAEHLARWPASRALLLDDAGQPLPAGRTLRQPDLAATYRSIAEHGVDWFYRGPYAAALDHWMRTNGGLITADDLAGYSTVERQPLVTTYRGRTIVGFPPPSSGGVHVAEILNIVENFDLAQIDKDDPAEMIHLVAEAMKLAFADRAHWLGDPAFARVPMGLVDKAYAAQLAARIDAARATPVAGAGQPPAADANIFRGHTTHIAAADAEGYWVAITTTVNTTFGSKVIVPGTGVFLNNQMDDFALAPGVPNAFGLVGNDANAVAPGKRPLSSMSPTIVLDENGEVILTVGAAGGPLIISQVVLAIINHIDLGLPIDEAVAAPRFHHQWSPDTLTVETTMPESLTGALAQRGHKIKTISRESAGVTQAIARDPANGALVGVHDPRRPGQAAGR